MNVNIKVRLSLISVARMLSFASTKMSYTTFTGRLNKLDSPAKIKRYINYLVTRFGLDHEPRTNNLNIIMAHLKKVGVYD